MKFTYNSGQRPLDGYTLKRGIGRGGFGEVYYAVSDGGKEVALKLVQGNQDVELRGMAQCLNLKHHNLVNLFDIRSDAQGDHWVVMEYISGEPLSAVLNRHPQGLPLDLVGQWFLALCQAVGYLHDHGIVHRDLKPANIFVENGIVKVGDYGLSKFIGSSQRTAQTQSVGTVHYMAPEISTGNYNKQIDVYAAGVILYEMLTGHVPFEGESAGEILMKHLTTPPDLGLLPPEYVAVVGKALAKNPVHRYATMAEMGKGLESVTRGAQGQRVPRSPQPERRPEPPRAEFAQPARARVVRLEAPSTVGVAPVRSLRAQAAELFGSLAGSTVLALVSTGVWAALGHSTLGLVDMGAEFFLTVATCWAVLIPAKFWASQRGDRWERRVVMMGLGIAVGMGALWLDGWPTHLPSDQPIKVVSTTSLTSTGFTLAAPVPQVAKYLSYFALAFFFMRWWKLADRRRQHRFSFAPIMAAGFWGLALLLVWPDPWRGTLVLTTAAAVVQLVSPWEQPPPPANRRLRLRYA